MGPSLCKAGGISKTEAMSIDHFEGQVYAFSQIIQEAIANKNGLV